MSSLLSVELSLIDEIFRGGERGYVLDFSNRTFADFFSRELDIDIDAPIYAADGVSKGKRLRCFLGTVDDGTAAGALRVLWEHREALRPPDGTDSFHAPPARLKGSSPSSRAMARSSPSM
jgi:hypothetical protein